MASTQTAKDRGIGGTHWTKVDGDTPGTGDLYMTPLVGTVQMGCGSGAPDATQDANHSAGDLFVDKTNGVLYIHDGTNWVVVGTQT